MTAGSKDRRRRLVWAGIVIAVGGFALAPVLFSHDAFSYLDYARLDVVHGLDPYVHPPSAAPRDAVYSHVTWKDATSAYGPLFTLATYPLAWLPVWLAVAALKATAALAVLATAFLVARLAPARGIAPLPAAAFVALNPLVLLHVVGGAHNDGVAMLLATVAIAAMLSAREAGAGATFVAAFAIKAPAALAAPFALVGAARMKPFTPYWGDKASIWQGRRPSARVLIGTGGAALAIGAAAYAAFGWHWLHGIGLASESRSSHLSIPSTAARLTGLSPTAGRAAALALYAALFIYLLAQTWRGQDWLRCAAWASLGLLLATSWLLPWYLIWALPLVALSRDRPLQLLTLALTAYQLPARLPL